MAALLAAYTLAVGAASLYVARGLRGPDDFLTGRRALGVAQGMGLLGGIFLGATAVGIVGQGYRLGWSGAALDLALALGFVVLRFTLLARLQASGEASLVGLLRRHYGSVAGTGGVVVVGGAWLVLLASFLAAAATILGELSGWSSEFCVVVAVVVLLLYAMPGGMRAVTATNLLMLVALAILLATVGALALDHGATRTPDSTSSVPWSYLAGIVLLSAPTTVVAPDVMLGMSSLRDLSAARRTLALVATLLIGGGLFLALLGQYASQLLFVADPEQALPRLIDLLLPAGLAELGLMVLFGAALAGAVSEVMVCTFMLDEEISARRRPGRYRPRGLTPVRLQLVAVAVLAGGLALANPHVVELVLTAFRVFVPGVVPQTILALLGRRTQSWPVVASMVAGPAVCLALATALPATRETVADPVVWGTLVAVIILALGRVPGTASRARPQHPH